MMHDALLGEKLGHSLSVPIHEAIFERLGIDADYRLIELPRDTVAAAEPRGVVYVSCNVATQARDAALLREAGYMLEKVQPGDMFCRTSGVEAVWDLYSKDGVAREKGS